MAYDEKLAARVRNVLGGTRGVSEKKMFGGLTFMLRDHMCCGIVGNKLMVRIGPEQTRKALTRAHTSKMDFTGKPLKGFLYVEPAGLRTARELRSWIGLAKNHIMKLPPK